MNLHDIDRVQAQLDLESAAGTFLGGPNKRYLQAGQMQFDLLKQAGLLPSHKVVDIGAGPLRAGLWLMDYLEPGNYYAIEPSRDALQAGIRILGTDRISNRQPQFFYNADFDCAVVGAHIDFGIARSIWTHAPFSDIERLLASWSECGHGRLFASFLRAYGRPYRGADWVGISHTSSKPGLVRYRLRDIQIAASDVGLQVKRHKGQRMGGQHWLEIS